jgi:4'-phosphopantetheinyl transferase
MTDVFWLEQREQDVPCGDGWLSPDEKRRLSGMRFVKRRNDWILGRWTAKRTLAAHFELPSDRGSLARIEIRSADCGAPEPVLDNRPAPVIISLSHRSGAAMCAIGACGLELGCDLEVIEPRTDGFVADFFTEEEQAFIRRAPVSESTRFKALIWAAKESTLKALRAGLCLDTRSVNVRITTPIALANDAVCWRPFDVCESGGRLFQGWWQSDSILLRTIVALPAPRVPVQLVGF